jgi:hypothetical protein
MLTEIMPTRGLHVFYRLAAYCAALFVVFSLVLGPLMFANSPTSFTADVCAGAGGRHVDVSGCADPAAQLDPEPASADESTAPPPPPDVSACVNAGRHVNVSACT